MNQRKLTENLSGIEAAFQNIPDAFFLMEILVNEDGKPYDFIYRYVNAAVRKTTNLSKEEFTDRSFSEIFHTAPPEKWLKPYAQAAFHNVSTTWEDYSEEIHEFVEVTCFPISEGFTGCFVKNITDKTLYEKTLNSSRLAYREIYFIDLVRDHYQLVFPIKPDHEKGRYSDAIQHHFETGKILPHDREAISDFLSLENIRKVLRDQDYIEYKYQRTAPNGGSEWCLTSISVEARIDGMPITASMSIRNIDSIIKADEQQRLLLTQALEDAQQANHAKSDFLSSMSHDMRTPLNVITGMATLARIHGEDPGIVKDCLEKIEVSSKHLLSLVNGVLDMAKIETGSIELDRSAFSLCDMMEDIVLMTQSVISSKHQVLNFSLQNPRHEDVIGDENRLTQAILNILTNAIKYTDRHGRIQMFIQEIGFDGKTAVYRFAIKDNGCGMSEDFIQHAFEPFTREIDLRLNKIAGTGLGLAITKKIIDEMGGTIQVNSKIDQGSEFILEIPLEIQQNNENEQTFPGERILIVDDYAPCIESICSVVEALESDCQAVTNGKDALAILEQEQSGNRPFTAVIVDYIMPDMDGITLASRIRKQFGSALPIIMVSAYDYSMVKKDAGKAGVNFFCTKPLFRSKLLRIFPYLHNPKALIRESNLLVQRRNRKLKALLVEDNPLNTQIAKRLLEYMGLEVDTAEDGKDAVDTFRRSLPGSYDCIFMDVQMPIMNGLIATKTIRAMEREDSNVPIFAMTANVFTEDVKRTREAGMQEHIGKPIDLSQLQHILERYFPEYDIAAPIHHS